MSSEPSGSIAQRQSLLQAPAPEQQLSEQEPSAQHHKQSGQQSTGSQPPAHAGSNVGNGNGAGNGEKKDQSRNSPDKRD